jgi:hypothetical protein
VDAAVIGAAAVGAGTPPPGAAGWALATPVIGATGGTTTWAGVAAVSACLADRPIRPTMMPMTISTRPLQKNPYTQR